MQSRYRTMVALLAVLLLAAAASTMGSYPVYLLSLAMINVIAAIGLNLLTGNSGQISLCHSSFIAIGACIGAIILINKRRGVRANTH